MFSWWLLVDITYNLLVLSLPQGNATNLHGVGGVLLVAKN
jgi:hypothetical protein